MDCKDIMMTGQGIEIPPCIDCEEFNQEKYNSLVEIAFSGILDIIN